MEKPDIYEEEGRWVYRFSSLGRCVRGMVAERRGDPPSSFPKKYTQEDTGYFEVGKKLEPEIIKRFIEGEEQGKTRWRLLSNSNMEDYHHFKSKYVSHDNQRQSSQFRVEIPIGADVLLRGHLDGVAVCYQAEKEEWLGAACTIEAKAFAESTFTKWVREGINGFPYYAVQVSLEVIGSGLPVAFVIGRKNDAGEVESINIYWFYEPPIPIGKIASTILSIEANCEADTLPDCSYRQYPCRFLHICQYAGEKKESKIVIDIEDDLLASLALRKIEGEEMIKEGEKIKKAASDGIKGWWGERTDDEKVEVGDFEIEMVSWKVPEKVTKAYEVRYPKVKVREKEDGTNGDKERAKDGE